MGSSKVLLTFATLAVMCFNATGKRRSSQVSCYKSCNYNEISILTHCREHLYKQHCIFPCQRCKTLFEDQAAVAFHQREPQPCQLQEIEHADGVTVEIVLKLKSKKKAPNQTEADRWRDIFKLLFPNEIIPSPCKSAHSPRVVRHIYSSRALLR